MVMIAHQNPRINKPSGLFASFIARSLRRQNELLGPPSRLYVPPIPAERLQMKGAANVSQQLSRAKKAAKPKIKPPTPAI
jgi:hypothetical protein